MNNGNMTSYEDVKSVSDSDFAEAAKDIDLSDSEKYTLTPSEDVRRIEDVLEVRHGTLTDSHYLSKYECECGRTLNVYDLVYTAVENNVHPKS